MIIPGSSYSLDATSGPLVTIAIPTFNRASWLTNCVTAALAQNFQQFEVLVSDNASTDETAEVLQKFRDPKLRVIRQQRNIGLLPNWNACLTEARGDYIIFVSDDDTVAPWLLERCIALVKDALQIPVVIALSDFYYAAQDRLEPALSSQRLGTGLWEGTEILEEFFEGRIMAAMCTIMIRTETLRAVGGFPTNLPNVGDTAAWAPLMLTGKAGLVNESCGTWRAHKASQSSKLDLDIWLNEILKLIDLISNAADHSIKNLEVRSRIKLHARRYSMLVTIYILYELRREGARLADVLPVMWRWRRLLIDLQLSDIPKLARPLSYLFLPGLITRGLRRIMRILKRSQLPALEKLSASP